MNEVPVEIKSFERYYLCSLLPMLFIDFYAVGFGGFDSGPIIGPLIFKVPLWIFLIFFTSRRKNKITRLLVTLWPVFQVASFASAFHITDMTYGDIPKFSPLFLLPVLSIILEFIGIIKLYSTNGKQWFEKVDG